MKEIVADIRKKSLLSEVASMYYEQNYSQSEIASRVCISRSRISRLLKEARDCGLVEIKIHYLEKRAYELEEILARELGIRDVYVINSLNLSYEDILCQIGSQAADYIGQHLHNHSTVGLSWGRTVSHTVAALTGNPELSISVVQVIGGADTSNPYVDIPALISNIVQKYDGKGYYLNAPLYVEDSFVRNEIIKQPLVTNALNKARNVDLLVTGVGDISDDTVKYMWVGYDDSRQLETLRKANAVGVICAQAFDIDGKPIQNGFNERIIGIKLKEIQKLPDVLCIAAGKSKALPLLGALHGGYVKTLIIDSNCAKEILLLQKERSQA